MISAPPGCAVKANVLALWRSRFVDFDGALEVECTCLTPKPVLDASGHTAKFSDYMVRDAVTSRCYRADHLLKTHLRTLLTDENLSEERRGELSLALARVDSFGREELDQCLRRYGAKAPETGNDISAPQPFNLMFATSIGPSGGVPGFLRPETAQGIFVNFKKLLAFNGARLPFAAAQVGTAFRSEISPRSGLLRVREFTLAEIEYFVHPQRKTHANFPLVMGVTLPLLTAERQTLNVFQPVNAYLGRAVQHDIIGNEALAYFMALTFLFLRGPKACAGQRPARMRHSRGAHPVSPAPALRDGALRGRLLGCGGSHLLRLD
jgi:glycyl-tRNA synthetase